MIINSVNEFEQYVNSLFSCKYLPEEDKEKMKNAIDLALKNIPGTNEKIKFICEYELKRNSISGFNKAKIFFCMQRLSKEENKEIIQYFIEKHSIKYSTDKQKLLIEMLDFLTEEKEKIRVSSKLSCENLFDLMDSMNWFKKKEKFSKKKYYKNYYNIFKEALEFKAEFR